MKVFFIHTLNAGTAWYRINGYAEHMSQIDGVEVRMNTYDPTNQIGAWWEPQLVNLPMLDQFLYQFETWGPDIVVMQKFMSPEGFAFHETCKEFWPVLTEVDDDFINVPCWNPAFSPQANAHYMAAMQLESTHALICSTPYLLDLFSKMYDKRGHVIPNGIDVEYWDNLPNPAKHSGINIGWVGAASHREDLKILVDVIPEVNKRYSDIQWLFMSGGGIPDEIVEHPNVRFIREWWPANEYARAVKLKGFDIGLAPLLDHPFNKAKSNLRWLEYSAMGIPTVASEIGHFNETIRHTETGFVCSNTEEWIEHISQLVERECSRKDIGKAAKEDISKNWNLKDISKRYADILSQEVKAK